MSNGVYIYEESQEVIHKRKVDRAKLLSIRYTCKVLIIGILVLVAFLMLFPYLYMVFTSFKSSHEVTTDMSFYLFPKEFTWENYVKIFDPNVIPLANGFLNTLIIEVVVLIVGTFTTTLGAFAFSRINFVGKNIVFYMLLTSMMIPYVAVLVPQYDAFLKLGWYDTLLPLIIPGLFGNVSMMFFLKQYADSIPNDVYEAAEVEGAGFFTIYWRVFLPLVRPAILAQVIFWFLGIWNDFLAPDLYLPTTENKTLQVMIRWFNQDAGGGGSLVNQPLVMAASVLSSIPTLTIYMIFQKYFVNTFMLSGVKR
jgi:multiple sugar transport system permease protein